MQNDECRIARVPIQDSVRLLGIPPDLVMCDDSNYSSARQEAAQFMKKFERVPGSLAPRPSPLTPHP